MNKVTIIFDEQLTFIEAIKHASEALDSWMEYKDRFFEGKLDGASFKFSNHDLMSNSESSTSVAFSGNAQELTLTVSIGDSQH